MLYSLLQIATNFFAVLNAIPCTIESFTFHCSETIKLFVRSIVQKHFFCIAWI